MNEKRMHMNINRINPLINLAVIVGLVSVGIITGMIIAPVKAQSTYARIGYVDIDQAVRAHPQYQTVADQIEAFRQAKEKELNDMKDSMSPDTITDAQRQSLVDKVNQIQSDVEAEETSHRSDSAEHCRRHRCNRQRIRNRSYS